MELWLSVFGQWIFNMTCPSCCAFLNLETMAKLKISSLQTNSLIALGLHKGLALQELNSLRRVEDSSAKPKLIAPGLLNLCVNDTMVFPPPPQQMPQGLPGCTCRQGCVSRCGARSGGRLLAPAWSSRARHTHTGALSTVIAISH